MHMSSFYEKLSMKLQGRGEEGGEGAKKDSPTSPKAVTYSATGEQKASAKEDTLAIQPATDAAPDGTDPIDVDLFQSDSRMVVFAQVSGVSADDFDVTLSEESNTLTIEAVQKRPDLPTAKGAKEGDPPEKGIYVKQEVKWRSLYRKIYLPASFDGGEATAVFGEGVLVIVLPAKHPGIGKKLAVREVQSEKKK
jgi:HSP20 family molecular chaperone IbpA